MPQAITLDSVVRASDDQMSARLGDDTVILELQTGTYYGLEGVALQIWSLIQGPKRVAELRDQIVESYDVSSERCERDLIRILGEMLEQKLIVCVDSGVGDR
ncbi:MAG: PqqD family protein [Thermoanaerobaculia bacterium]|nr:PqqD family protein [Thermoanaerobaculia bacterium]